MLTFAPTAAPVALSCAPVSAPQGGGCPKHYARLRRAFRGLSDVDGALAILDWDQPVMMPPGGNRARGEQMATLRQIAHELLIIAETGELLARAEQDAAELEPWQVANLREMRRSQRRATAMPSRPWSRRWRAPPPLPR